MPDDVISIIIRTRNEEKWISFCLKSISEQEIDAKIEIVLVDNESTDATVDIASRLGVNKIVKISNFLPGKALNRGIKASSGKYIVCLSAHCIPESKHWLNSLVRNFKSKENIAGVYGRQLPLSYTDPVDKRDLMIVFGLDRKIQEKDYFFHNANSIIPRSVWDKFPFDENVTNIEDRVWGKKIIDAGYKIIYDPDAAVYHHHGLHQGNSPKRAKGVVSIMEDVDREDMNSIPFQMHPEKINVAALLPVSGKISNEDSRFNQIKTTVDFVLKSKYISNIYVLSENKLFEKLNRVKFLDRKKISDSYKLSINKLLRCSLDMIENESHYPDAMIYVNYDYQHKPVGVYDEIITLAQTNGFETVFPGLVDYGHYWYQDEDDKYNQTDSSLKSRDKRDPVFKALYGQGCFSLATVIRKGKILGEKVGILKIQNQKYAKRIKV